MKEDAQLICPVSFEDPSNWWNKFQQELVDRLPLRDVTWKSPISSSYITIDKLPLKFLPASANLFKDTEHSFRWFLAPYVYLYVLCAESIESYKASRVYLKTWVDALNSKKASWLVLYLPSGDNTLEFYNKVYSRLCNDFYADRTGDRAVMLILSDCNFRNPTYYVTPKPLSSPINQSALYMNSFNELFFKIREGIVASFQHRSAQYDTDIRRLDLARGTELFDFRQLFLVKESLALMYQMMQLPDHALGQYEEIEAILSYVPDGALPESDWPMVSVEPLKSAPTKGDNNEMNTTTNPTEATSSTTNTRDKDKDAMSDACKNGDNVVAYSINLARMKILRGQMSLLEFYRYVFARQMYFLIHLERPVHCSEKAFTFIMFCGNYIHRKLKEKYGMNEISKSKVVDNEADSPDSSSFELRSYQADLWLLTASIKVTRVCRDLTLRLLHDKNAPNATATDHTMTLATSIQYFSNRPSYPIVDPLQSFTSQQQQYSMAELNGSDLPPIPNGNNPKTLAFSQQRTDPTNNDDDKDASNLSIHQSEASMGITTGLQPSYSSPQLLSRTGSAASLLTPSPSSTSIVVKEVASNKQPIALSVLKETAKILCEVLQYALSRLHQLAPYTVKTFRKTSTDVIQFLEPWFDSLNNSQQVDQDSINPKEAVLTHQLPTLKMIPSDIDVTEEYVLAMEFELFNNGFDRLNNVDQTLILISQKIRSASHFWAKYFGSNYLNQSANLSRQASSVGLSIATLGSTRSFNSSRPNLIDSPSTSVTTAQQRYTRPGRSSSTSLQSRDGSISLSRREKGRLLEVTLASLICKSLWELLALAERPRTAYMYRLYCADLFLCNGLYYRAIRLYDEVCCMSLQNKIRNILANFRQSKYFEEHQAIPSDHITKDPGENGVDDARQENTLNRPSVPTVTFQQDSIKVSNWNPNPNSSTLHLPSDFYVQLSNDCEWSELRLWILLKMLYCARICEDSLVYRMLACQILDPQLIDSPSIRSDRLAFFNFIGTSKLKLELFRDVCQLSKESNPPPTYENETAQPAIHDIIQSSSTTLCENQSPRFDKNGETSFNFIDSSTPARDEEETDPGPSTVLKDMLSQHHDIDHLKPSTSKSSPLVLHLPLVSYFDVSITRPNLDHCGLEEINGYQNIFDDYYPVTVIQCIGGEQKYFPLHLNIHSKLPDEIQLDSIQIIYKKFSVSEILSQQNLSNPLMMNYLLPTPRSSEIDVGVIANEDPRTKLMSVKMSMPIVQSNEERPSMLNDLDYHQQVLLAAVNDQLHHPDENNASIITEHVQEDHHEFECIASHLPIDYTTDQLEEAILSINPTNPNDKYVIHPGDQTVLIYFSPPGLGDYRLDRIILKSGTLHFETEYLRPRHPFIDHHLHASGSESSDIDVTRPHSSHPPSHNGVVTSTNPNYFYSLTQLSLRKYFFDHRMIRVISPDDHLGVSILAPVKSPIGQIDDVCLQFHTKSRDVIQSISFFAAGYRTNTDETAPKQPGLSSSETPGTAPISLINHVRRQSSFREVDTSEKSGTRSSKSPFMKGKELIAWEDDDGMENGGTKRIKGMAVLKVFSVVDWEMNVESPSAKSEDDVMSAELINFDGLVIHPEELSNPQMSSSPVLLKLSNVNSSHSIRMRIPFQSKLVGPIDDPISYHDDADIDSSLDHTMYLGVTMKGTLLRNDCIIPFSFTIFCELHVGDFAIVQLEDDLDSIPLYYPTLPNSAESRPDENSQMIELFLQNVVANLSQLPIELIGFNVKVGSSDGDSPINHMVSDDSKWANYQKIIHFIHGLSSVSLPDEKGINRHSISDIVLKVLGGGRANTMWSPNQRINLQPFESYFFALNIGVTFHHMMRYLEESQGIIRMSLTYRRQQTTGSSSDPFVSLFSLRYFISTFDIPLINLLKPIHALHQIQESSDPLIDSNHRGDEDHLNSLAIVDENLMSESERLIDEIQFSLRIDASHVPPHPLGGPVVIPYLFSINLASQGVQGMDPPAIYQPLSVDGSNPLDQAAVRLHDICMLEYVAVEIQETDGFLIVGTRTFPLSDQSLVLLKKNSDPMQSKMTTIQYSFPITMVRLIASTHYPPMKVIYSIKQVSKHSNCDEKVHEIHSLISNVTQSEPGDIDEDIDAVKHLKHNDMYRWNQWLTAFSDQVTGDLMTKDVQDWYGHQSKPPSRCRFEIVYPQEHLHDALESNNGQPIEETVALSGQIKYSVGQFTRLF